MTDAPRPPEQRRIDTLALLQRPAIGVWVSTASLGPDGSPRPYLVPLSLAWIDERIVLALEAASRTARSLLEHRIARLALGASRDVVMIDAVLDEAFEAASVPEPIADGYAGQADWDPRRAGAGMVYLVLRPERIQAWREANEIAGRTLMRDGRWLV